MKVTGPMCSMESHGTIGGILSAATWRTRQYFKKNTKPRTAYTAAQRSARCRIGLLKSFWAHLDSYTGTNAQAQWTAIADLETTSAYHEYLRYNMDRWTDTTGAIVYPGATGNNGQSVLWTLYQFTADSAFGDMLIQPDATQFGNVFYLDPEVLDPCPAKYIAWIQPNLGAAASKKRITISHIAPGSYQLWKRSLYIDGTLGSQDSIGFHTFP